MDGRQRRLPSQTGAGYHAGRFVVPGEPSVSSLFRHNPIRRAATVIGISGAAVTGSVLLLDGATPGNGPLLIVAAAGAAILLLVVPLLLWSLAAEGRRRWRRRASPDLAVLGLPLRTENILRRAGHETIADLIHLNDDALLSLPRLEEPDLRAIHRQWSLFEYQEWQARGFRDR